MLELDADHHVRTVFSEGMDTVDRMGAAADAIGLRRLVVADLISTDTDWLPSYTRAVGRAAERTRATLVCGAETTVLNTSGDLDLPPALPGIDYLAVGCRGFPLRGGQGTAADVRMLLGTGVLTAHNLMELLIKSIVAGLARAREAAQPGLCRPFSELGSVGMSESELDDGLLDVLAAGCLAVGAVVEVNELWRCPSAHTAAYLAEAGVVLVAASDARTAAAVGGWQYVDSVASELTRTADAPAG